MVGKAKWKPLELSLPGKIVNHKQYPIPGGTSEISATIKDLKDAVMSIPTTSPFSYPVWPVQKTMDHGELELTIKNLSSYSNCSFCVRCGFLT